MNCTNAGLGSAGQDKILVRLIQIPTKIKPWVPQPLPLLPVTITPFLHGDYLIFSLGNHHENK
jgi:hypothetical protein